MLRYVYTPKSAKKIVTSLEPDGDTELCELNSPWKTVEEKERDRLGEK